MAAMRWFQNFLSNQEASPLEGSVLLTGLSASDLNIVQGFMHERSYLPNEIVFDQGEEGQALYFVLSGRVLICLPGQQSKPIAELSQGSFFGELALLDNWPRSAQAVAGAETQLAVLFRGDFERLMESHARIASKISMQLARHLGLRLRDMLERQKSASPEL